MRKTAATVCHAVLAALVLAGAAAWIWRSTGFDPLVLTGNRG